jgi:hypothetical protein
VPEAGTTQLQLPSFLAFGATPTSLKLTITSAVRHLKALARWSLRSSSDRTRSFRFPHDQPGHPVQGPPTCCQRVSSKGSLTTQHARGEKCCWNRPCQSGLTLSTRRLQAVSASPSLQLRRLLVRPQSLSSRILHAYNLVYSAKDAHPTPSLGS